MSTPLRICIAINKDGATLRPSESFLRAHIERLPGQKYPLIGIPGARRLGVNEGRFLLSQQLIWRALRRGIRAVRGFTTLDQDTPSVVRLLRRERIDVVLAEYGPTAVSIQRACAEANVPLVTHFHGWDAYVLATDPARAADYRALFSQSEAIVAVSRHMREHLKSLGAPPDRVIWNPCGADPNRAIPARPAAAPPIFVAIGRAAPKKALIVTLLAFAQVHRNLPDARLEIVGAQLDAPTYQTLRALKIEEQVALLGTMAHDKVLERLSMARCYVHPSVTAPDGDMEGTPVSILEAMAAGLPVVSTRHGGIVDVLNGKAGGLLVDEYDVDATADAMLTYARDPDRAARDGAVARRELEIRWSMARSVSRLAQIVEASAAKDSATISRQAREEF